jgi:hypothetical protein
MKAYGRRKNDDLVYNFGPPSREKKHTSKFRQSSRRLLHKQGRNDNRKELAAAVED